MLPVNVVMALVIPMKIVKAVLLIAVNVVTALMVIL